MKRKEKPFDVTIQTATKLQTRAAVLTKDVYFEGGDVLRCYKGRFRFVLDGRDPIEISAGEALVTYPDQRVTIEALDRDNLLLYVVFMGAGVGEYLTVLDSSMVSTERRAISAFRLILLRQEQSGARVSTIGECGIVSPMP